MTIILFLIDTSGSMNQRTHNGARSTLLDVAKETIEKIIRLRQRDQSARTDRYMLLTFDEAPYNIKAGWKENHQVFMNELKNLSANGMTTMASALKNAFDYLNLNRMVSGIDTYGAGRCPYYNETAIIISITDGAKYATTTNVQRELIIPMNTLAFGADLSSEPFRWDQRLYSLVLRLSGTYASDNGQDFCNGVMSAQCNVPADEGPIGAMCSVTGGRSYCITSIKALNASIENLATRMHNGVMLWFQKDKEDPPPLPLNDDDNFDTSKFANYDVHQFSKQTWTSVRNLIYVRSEPRQKPFGYGNWPIPEAYIPEPSLTTLPPRTAQPIVKFKCTDVEPAMLPTLPFDKYELDPSPLTQFILSRRQPNATWQCFVPNSSRIEHPFGYLKASTSLTCVNLFVFPFNYPKLLPLLNDFITKQGKVSREWRAEFDAYLKTMPVYYGPSLKKALGKMNINANLFPIPDIETHINVSITNHIKKQKGLAKIEADKLSAAVGLTRPIAVDWPRATNSHVFNASHGRKLGALSDSAYGSNPVLRRVFSSLQNDQDFTGFVIRYKEKPKSRSKVHTYRNPFDVDRHDVITQLNKLRDNYFQKQATSIRCQDEDVLHNLPVSQMGNYQDYIKKLPQPLRELESTPTRQHMFGNPFKVDRKNPSMMIDEADMADMAGGGGAGNGGSNIPKGSKRSADTYAPPPPKKKKGPIPRDSPYYRTPPPSPNPHLSPPHMYATPPPSPQVLIMAQNGFLPPATTSPSLSTSSSSVEPFNSCSAIPSSTSSSSSYNHHNSFIPIMINHETNGTNNKLHAMSNGVDANKLNHNNKFCNENNFALLSNHMANSSRNSAMNCVPRANNNSSPVSQPMVNGKAKASPSGSRPLSLTTLLLNGGKNDSFGVYHLLMLDTFRKKNLSQEDFVAKKSLLNQVLSPSGEYSALIRSLASTPGHFGEYLLFEVFDLAFRFNQHSLLHQLKKSFPEKGVHLFGLYNLRSLPESSSI